MLIQTRLITTLPQRLQKDVCIQEGQSLEAKDFSLLLAIIVFEWVAAKTTQTPIYPTHSPKDRFTQFLERRQNFTHSPKA